MINKKTYVTSNAIVALFYLSKGWVAVDHHVSRNHRKITVKLEAPALPPQSAECQDLARDVEREMVNEVVAEKLLPVLLEA